jgi:type IV pilus assembly protein PilE
MQRRSGFSLIELMVAVAIVAIIAAIALPSYQAYLRRANRSAAEQVMLTIQSREEQYFLDARQYTATIGAGGLGIASQDTFRSCAATCTNDFYTVSVSTVAGPPPGYFVRAVPIASSYQNSDGTLYLNANTAGAFTPGAKTRTAGDNKW